jgi:hypothetical protein
MRWARTVARVEDWDMHTELCSEKTERRYNLECLHKDRRIILKRIRNLMGLYGQDSTALSQNTLR